MSGVSPAVRLLVIGGMLNLSLSFLLGWLLSARRMRESIEGHRWLLTAHTVSLQEGLMLLGIAYAMSLTRGTSPLAMWAAWLLVAGSAFQDFSGVANWLRKIDDQFANRSFGWMLATVNAVLNTAGLGLAVYLVLTD